MVLKIKDLILKILCKYMPKGLQRKILEHHNVLPFGRISYAQEGEDLILESLLENKNNGFYIDVGAHHPIKFSNTYKFYLKGWHGINIDAMPGSMIRFNKIRKNDTNLEYAISNTSGYADFYVFDEPALNTLSNKDAIEIVKLGRYKLLNKMKIETITINEVLDKFYVSDNDIDFLSIDIEGLDKLVLKNLNFLKYRPKIILFEDHNYSNNKLSDIEPYLNSCGYNYIAKTLRTVFYRKYVKDEK